MSVRSAVALQQGADDDLLERVDHYEDSDLSDAQKAALRLADAYLGCQERRPAVWPGMETGGPETAARLWLAAASATALRAGLDLLGVDAPVRL